MTTFDTAIKYAGVGLRVIPIKPGEKRPPMPSWQDVATTDKATIEHGVGVAS